MTQDVVVIGAGVIGLNVAYELAGRGRRVTLLDAQQPGREASWAGAGILPPGCPGDPRHPLAVLTAASHELWFQLSAELRETTGVDNGFRRCGGIGAAASDSDAAALAAEVNGWKTAHVRVEVLSADDLAACEPSLRRQSGAYRLPDVCQVRNPRHLKALEIGCARRGVVVRSGQPVVEFEHRGDRVSALLTPTDRFEGDQFLVAAGPWSQQLLAQSNCRLDIEPVRGQIVLLSSPRPLLQHVIECGPRYLVPRPDGRVLVGSTEETVGFDKQNTAQAMGDLLTFAQTLAPALAEARFERAWAGLRPHARRGLPYLGRHPDIENLFIAAGHFRSGLTLSPITARLMSQLMLGEPPDLPMDAYAVDR